MDGGIGSEEEYHETLEDITSASSSAESSDESNGNKSMRGRSIKVAPATTGHERPPVWTSSSYQAKFSVWKDDTSSINERRQRFFKQMGLKNLREEPNAGPASSLLGRSLFPGGGEEMVTKKAMGSVKEENGAAETSSELNDKSGCQVCRAETGDLSHICEHLNLSKGKVLQRQVGKRVDSFNSIPSENGVKLDFHAAATTGVGNDGERLTETSGAVLREGKSRSGPISSGPVSNNSVPTHKSTRSGPLKPSDCPVSADSNGAVHRSHRSSCGNSPDMSPNMEVTSKVLVSPEGSLSPLWTGTEMTGHLHKVSSSQEKLSQSYNTDDGYDTLSQDGYSAVEENGNEDVLKIRDLDSGKEFVMNRFNRDGTLNMLREVDTGKELTLAEFEKTLGLSPITQELRRRQRAAQSRVSNEKPGLLESSNTSATTAAATKKKGWLKNLKGALSVRSSKEKPLTGGSARSEKGGNSQSGDDTDGSSKGGRLSRGSSKGGNSREGSFAAPDREESVKGGALRVEENSVIPLWKQPQKVKVKLRRKSMKELSDLHMGQEIQAHQGAIWTMKFCPDGQYLASAGQDRVVHVWEVLDHPSVAESDSWGGFDNGNVTAGLQHQGSTRADKEGSVKGRYEGSTKGGDKDGSTRGERDGSTRGERDGSTRGERDGSTRGERDGSTKGGKPTAHRRKSGNLDSKVPVPKLFWLSEKPKRSFRGHTGDVLDVSWSESKFLLSSSMDKTVRLWHIDHEECLRIFSHNDYVTCVVFNPIDDHYFLSGALDDKVRIWSIPDHQVVDWSDLREMVTAVCYTPDGEKAIVGSYKGTCRFYNTSGNKLQLEASIDVRTENKKGRGKKITGLHCMPGDPEKVLVTSNDSRIRVYDGHELWAKYKGLKNINSQISASYSPNGEYIISSSEDSRVLIWSSVNRDTSTNKSLYRRDKQQSCEEFYARDVSLAIPWPKPSSRQSLSRPGSETPGLSDRIGSARATSDLESPAQEVADGAGSRCCPSSCLETSTPPTVNLGSFRKSDVAHEHHSTMKQRIDGDTNNVSPGQTHHGARLSNASLSDLSARHSFDSPVLLGECEDSPPHLQQTTCTSFFPDSGPRASSATWPEEKLPSFGQRLASGPALTHSPSVGSDTMPAVLQMSPVIESSAVSAAWGLVIVTAGLGGEITTFQNYGLPVRL